MHRNMTPSTIIEARRKRTERVWSLTDTIVLIAAGSPVSKPGHADQCYEYEPHTDFYWLSGVRRAGSVLAYDPGEGWKLFAPPVTQLERVWEQVVEAPGATDIAELQDWVKSRNGKKIAILGCAIPGIECDEDLAYELGVAFLDERRLKDEHEVSLMRRAALATAQGHRDGLEAIKEGVTEIQLRAVIEKGFVDGGGEGLGYHTIVGIGGNSAVFHFTPGRKKAQVGDFVLIDAGASVEHYVADVTRTHVVGEMAVWQRDVYAGVTRAIDASIALCKPGVKWVDVHIASAREISGALRAMGFLLCSEDEAIETGAIAMFFPHGVGHAVGLGVRDSGGPWPRREKGTEIAGVKIRVDMALQQGYVMTVEPGMYFVPALLDDPENREKHADRVAWDKVAPFVGKGGVRLEDNVLITPQGCENLTSMIPR